MPASLFHENQDQLNQNIQSSGNSLEDNQVIQLALELSAFGSMFKDEEALQAAFTLEATNRLKKSQNTTECVPVPSSEHVAEIVGRQGCKIKALRSKTNTYIKTPVRGEEPVFVVTGRKEDVNAAKREILSAADHFSQIRAQRKNSLVGGGAVGLNGTNGQPLPGQCTIKVRVPYRVVGLVVGPKGATIKRIQHETSTYIITPSREKEPVFEVTGLPESVKKARYQIEAHIANRTGLSKLNALSLTSLIDDLDGSGSASSSGGSSLTSGLPFDLNYILNSSSAPNSDASTFELFQKMFLNNQDSTKNTLTNETDNKWDLLQTNTNGSSLNPSIESALAGNGTSGALHSSFGLANKNAADFDNFSSFKMNAGRSLLKNNLNSFDNSSGGSNSSSSSVSGSSGPSRTSTLHSLVAQASSFVMNNLSSINSENASKMLLNSSAGNPTSTNETLNDFYEQLLSNSSSRPSHITSSVSNGSQLHNASSVISSSASSTQLTRSNSPSSNHHNSLSTSVGTSLNSQNPSSFLTTSNASINPSSGNTNGQSSSSGNEITSALASLLYDRDEGIGESPTFDSVAAANFANVVSSMIARN